jgi:hypothetical protein
MGRLLAVAICLHAAELKQTTRSRLARYYPNRWTSQSIYLLLHAGKERCIAAGLREKTNCLDGFPAGKFKLTRESSFQCGFQALTQAAAFLFAAQRFL